MYIEPNSTIKFYRELPLDNTYAHTLWWTYTEGDEASKAKGRAEQNDFFHGSGSSKYLKYTFDKNTYARVVKGRLRIGMVSDNLYDVSYMAFRNSNYGSKWFYAFVTSVEFVNNVTCEVTFEIDVMQTYFFDFGFRPSLVEREHVSDDTIGANTVAETIDFGDIICSRVIPTGLFANQTAVISKASTGDGDVVGGYIGGLFTGCSYTGHDLNSTLGVRALTEELSEIVANNQQDSVVSLFMMPTSFYTTNSTPVTKTFSVNRPSVFHNEQNSHDYSPKNNKLLTYPYSYLVVDCGNNSASYRWEYFGDSMASFVLIGTTTTNPQVMAVPENYNGTQGYNYTENLTLSGFPQVAWSVDSFRAWLAQSAVGTGISAVGNVGTMIAGGIAGSVAGVVGGALGLANNINNVIKGYNQPDQVKGVDNGSVLTAIDAKDFYFKYMQVKIEYAKIIDEYFTAYGYAINRVKVPNRSSRPHWNYVKVAEPNVIGNMPADDLAKIIQIHKNGITYWKNASEFGQYGLDNSQTGGGAVG